MRTKALAQVSQCVKIPACTPQFKLLCRCFLACVFISNITSPKATAQVSVPSSITTNTTWTAVDNPYVATHDVTVELGVILTIEPGVVVKFGENDSMYVKGDLIANGTSGDEIVFTSLKDDSDGNDTNGDGNSSTPPANDWGGLSFADTCSGSLLNHVVVRYGGQEWSSPMSQAVPAIYVFASNLTINSSTVTENGSEGIKVYLCSPLIQNNILTNNGGDGIYLYSASPTISGNAIAGNGGYGIIARLSSNPQILGNSLEGNARWAIGVDPSGSGITIQGNELLGPRAGIFVRAGELTADTVWSSDSVYVVNYYRDSYTMGGLTVNEGTTLTIEHGVVTKFEELARLLVSGALVAEGTAGNQVVFTSLKDDSHGGDTNGDANTTTPAKDDWGGISLLDTCQQGVLNHVIISYAGRRLCWPNTCNSPAIYVGTPNVQISNSVISDNGHHGIHISLGGLTTSNIVIENNTISRNGDNAYGVVLAYGLAEIVRNVISENSRGMYLAHSIGSSIYLNNFVDNTSYNAYNVDSAAVWCSPAQLTYVYNGNTYINYLGNYWDDYIGMDSNGDGIGFPPYSIGVDYDNFPLMIPFENYSIGGDPPECDNYADLGNPTDEVNHNLTGWDEVFTWDESQSGDTTARCMRIGQNNYLNIYVPQANISYLLIAEVIDGECNDSFKIYVNGNEKYSYTSDPFDGITIETHKVGIPAEDITNSCVLINFKSEASDLGCPNAGHEYGRAPVYNVHLITSRIFPYEAAELAKQVIGAPYLGDGKTYGGKGYNCWSCLPQRFVHPDEIKTSGYCYYDGRIKTCNTEKAAGVDCSGLIFWAYNRAYLGNKELTGEDIKNSPIPFYCDGAACQYRDKHSYKIEKEELLPGDLLFFVGHVAMYIGEDKVIHSEGVLFKEIVEENLEIVLARYSNYFKDFRRLKDSEKPEFLILGKSPIDIIVTDPDGCTITKELWEASGMYYREYDIDGDGEPDDMVAVPKRKIGDYLIEVVPEANALPNDTYSLEATIDGQTMVLANEVPIEDIPEEPYELESKLNRSDFITDGIVNFIDYASFAWQWMSDDCNYPGWCEGCDLNYDHKLDYEDLTEFIENWLWEKIPADFNIDGDVNFADYVILSNQWLQPPAVPSADIAPEIPDGVVDMLDLAVLAKHWLEGTAP